MTEQELIQAELARVLGDNPGVTAEDVIDRGGLVVVTGSGIRSFPMGAWIPARERLMGRFTGDERRDAWQNDPHLIHALLPGAVTALLSADDGKTDKPAALVAAIASHVAGGVVLNRLGGVVVIHGPEQTRAVARHLKQAGYL